MYSVRRIIGSLVAVTSFYCHLLNLYNIVNPYSPKAIPYGGRSCHLTIMEITIKCSQLERSKSIALNVTSNVNID